MGFQLACLSFSLAQFCKKTEKVQTVFSVSFFFIKKKSTESKEQLKLKMNTNYSVFTKLIYVNNCYLYHCHGLYTALFEPYPEFSV